MASPTGARGRVVRARARTRRRTTQRAARRRPRRSCPRRRPSVRPGTRRAGSRTRSGSRVHTGQVDRPRPTGSATAKGQLKSDRSPDQGDTLHRADHRRQGRPADPRAPRATHPRSRPRPGPLATTPWRYPHGNWIAVLPMTEGLGYYEFSPGADLSMPKPLLCAPLPLSPGSGR